MMLSFARRMMTEPDRRLVWKFAYNFGYKGMRSVQLYKKRLRRGEHFPPFLFISIINSCQLRCQGCWVDVEAERQFISLDDMNRLLNDAKRHGNSYFGILGGEPFLHPELFRILAAHPDCYFQIFTNGQLISDEVHAPDLGSSARRCLHHSMHRGDMTPGPLASQTQVFLAVHTIEALLANIPPFPPQKHVEPSIPEPDACVRELTHALP